MPSARARATAPPALAMMSLMPMHATVGISYVPCQAANVGYSYSVAFTDGHDGAMQNDAPTIGGRIKALRVGRGLTQAVVAEAVGLERASLSMIERGHDRPGLHTLRALADYFGVTLDYLESGSAAAGVQMPADAEQPADEAELLAIWRRLDLSSRAAIVSLMERLVGMPSGDADHHSSTTKSTA